MKPVSEDEVGWEDNVGWEDELTSMDEVGSAAKVEKVEEVASVFKSRGKRKGGVAEGIQTREAALQLLPLVIVELKPDYFTAEIRSL